MKKALFAVLFAFASSSFSCEDLLTTKSENIKRIVKEHGGWQVSESQCSIVTSQRLAILVDGQAAVLGGVSVAWVNVKLHSVDANVMSDQTSRRTSVNVNYASQDVADAMLYKAITDAISELNFPKASAEIKSYLVKNKLRK